MNNELNNLNRKPDEIDLGELSGLIWKEKWTILITTFFISAICALYIINIPDMYKSEVTLAPVSEGNNLQIPGQLGGLAALAGVNLGGIGAGDKTAIALEMLKSRVFIKDFIERNDLYLPIMAAKKWDKVNDKIIFDSNIYDENTKTWIRKVKPPFQVKPSSLETYEEFLKLYTVSKDKETGMINLSVEHYSPYLAKAWVELLVKSVNEEMRKKELLEAERSIEYLSLQIDKTKVSDVRTVLFSLIEEQTKTVMLANVREEYVLATIDPPVIPEKKIRPNRILLLIFSTSIALLGVCLFVVLYKIKTRK